MYMCTAKILPNGQCHKCHSARRQELKHVLRVRLSLVLWCRCLNCYCYKNTNQAGKSCREMFSWFYGLCLFGRDWSGNDGHGSIEGRRYHHRDTTVSAHHHTDCDGRLCGSSSDEVSGNKIVNTIQYVKNKYVQFNAHNSVHITWCI